MGFKFANSNTIKKDLPEGQWVEVREEIAKDTFNKLVDYMPQREVDENSNLTPGEGVRFQEGLFAALVTAWSAPQPANVESYKQLKPEDEVTQALDKVLAEHFKSLTPGADESKAPTTSPEDSPKD